MTLHAALAQLVATLKSDNWQAISAHATTSCQWSDRRAAKSPAQVCCTSSESCLLNRAPLVVLQCSPHAHDNMQADDALSMCKVYPAQESADFMLSISNDPGYLARATSFQHRVLYHPYRMKHCRLPGGCPKCSKETSGTKQYDQWGRVPSLSILTYVYETW